MGERFTLRQEDVKFSRFLSLVLRHQPEKVGLKLDREGWVHVIHCLKLSVITGWMRSLS